MHMKTKGSSLGGRDSLCGVSWYVMRLIPYLFREDKLRKKERIQIEKKMGRRDEQDNAV